MSRKYGSRLRVKRVLGADTERFTLRQSVLIFLTLETRKTLLCFSAPAVYRSPGWLTGENFFLRRVSH